MTLVVLLAVSVGLNVVLVNRLPLRRQPPRADSRRVMPAMEAKALKGDTVTIPVSGQEAATILYVFTPQCAWCAKNRPNFETLVASVTGRYRIIGLSLTDKDLESYVSSAKWAFPVYHSPASLSLKAYEFGVTPETLVFCSNGTILGRWSGAWVRANQLAIQKRFGVALPGLLVLPSAESRTSK
jgi:hypothetical protein